MRTRTLAAVLLTLAAATLTGCSASDDTTDGGETAGTGGSAFPVTVASSLGGAVIDAKPKRVVTLGQGTADTVFALGTTPVGVEADAWGGDADGYQPWFRDAVEKAGDDLPELITASPEIDVESIVELDPDVILAPQSGLTQKQFDTLSALAPTVAYPGDAWSTAWDDQIEIIGTALGESDQAAQLVDDVDAELAAVADANPEYADHDFAYLYTGDVGALGVFQPNEPRVAILAKMGLTVDPVVEKQPVTEGTASSVLGLEKADLFDDTDLIFTFYSNDENRREIEAQSLYSSIPAIERGSVVWTADQSFVTASSLITPLTVPYVVDDYVAMIDDALARVG